MPGGDAEGGAGRGRTLAPLGRGLLQPTLSVLVALVIGAVVMLAFGFDPVQGYSGLFRYAFVGKPCDAVALSQPGDGEQWLRTRPRSWHRRSA